MKAALVFAVLVAGTAVALAAPDMGECILDTTTSVGFKQDFKSCSACQWQCLTDDHCNSIRFDGETFTRAELSLIGDCGDGYFVDATRSPGLCVLFDANSDFFIGQIFDTQEQTCPECAQQCNTDSRCTSFAHNGVALPKGSECGAPAPPPVVVAVVPSPVPVVPSPVPVVPSPVPVIPSPVPPPPSPRPVQPGIVVRPGICNYDIINYEVAVISTQVIFDSDDCCGLCANTTGCNVAQFCFDSEDNGGCGVDGATPRYTCRLGTAVLGADGFPSATIPQTAPESKGWITVTVTPTNTPGLF